MTAAGVDRTIQNGAASPSNLPPTSDWAHNFDTAYDWFNARLFDDALPPALITLQRKGGAYGYFCHKRFSALTDSADKLDEIALNPAWFARGPDLVLSTLVHEMVHLHQQHHGKPGRGGYHNAEWARWMADIGLMPSSTGAPGGMRTGDRMSHYIIENGAFARSCAALLASGFILRYGDARIDPDGRASLRKRRSAQSKIKYSCPNCRATTAWAKPGADLRCGAVTAISRNADGLHQDPLSHIQARRRAPALVLAARAAASRCRPSFDPARG